jgi:hypothetical protein
VPEEEPTPRYVSLDPDGEVIRLRLPSDDEPYRGELLEELAEEFGFEPRDARTERRMNDYVAAWLAKRRPDRPPAGP